MSASDQSSTLSLQLSNFRPVMLSSDVSEESRRWGRYQRKQVLSGMLPGVAGIRCASRRGLAQNIRSTCRTDRISTVSLTWVAVWTEVR